MKYFKQYVDENEKNEVSYSEALKTLLTTYQNNKATRDMLKDAGTIPCRCSTIFVEKE